MSRTLHIDSLDLDLRGIDPALAEAAVRLLGPALQREFAMANGSMERAGHIDASRIVPTSEPQALADRLASRIVMTTQARTQERTPKD